MKLTTEQLYNRISGDEDARVCKDIPANACQHQPHNFFIYLWANLLGKVADEISSAKLIIPWLFGVLGVPAAITGFLVPIREAGVLLPQLLVAAAVRHRPVRTPVWVLGALLSALSLVGMAWAAWQMQGVAAGLVIIAWLVLFSLARGICSVSAKDVLGKTVSKSRRGALMGWSASLSGVVVLAVGLALGWFDWQAAGALVFAGLLLSGALLWILAAGIFSRMREQPGATEGGGNALTVAVKQLGLLIEDAAFRQFVVARALLLSVALAPPFYVLVAQQYSESGLAGLGILIIANGLAASLSSPFWGYMGDRSSRSVMVIASSGTALLGFVSFAAVYWQWSGLNNDWGLALLFLLLNIMHGGVRLGRKVYLVDMATAENRAAYVAVSNTVIGVLMLLGGFVGLLGDWFGAAGVILLLAVVSLLAAFYISRLNDVSDSQ